MIQQLQVPVQGYVQSGLAQINADFTKTMVNGIREIGQAVEGHIKENKTREDIAALGKELAGLDAASDTYLQDMAKVASQHPFAMSDPRGKGVVEMVATGYGNLQKQKQDERNFQQQRQLNREQFGYQEKIHGLDNDARRVLAGDKAESNLREIDLRGDQKLLDLKQRGANAEQLEEQRALNRRERDEAERQNKTQGFAPDTTIYRGGVEVGRTGPRTVAPGADRNAITGNARLASIDKDIAGLRASSDKIAAADAKLATPRGQAEREAIQAKIVSLEDEKRKLMAAPALPPIGGNNTPGAFAPEMTLDDPLQADPGSVMPSNIPRQPARAKDWQRFIQ